MMISSAREVKPSPHSREANSLPITKVKRLRHIAAFELKADNSGALLQYF